MATVDERTQEKREELKELFIDYAPKALVAFMTGYFTWHAAWFLTENYVMSVATVALAEGFWFLWQFLRDENAENKEQTKNANFGWRVSIGFVVVTDLSSSVFMAHNAGFSVFATIPTWAEIAPAVLIPLMAVFQGVMLAVYSGNSDSREERMKTKKELRNSRNLIKLSKAQAKTKIAQSEAERRAQLADQEAPRIGNDRAETEWQNNYGNHATMPINAETDLPQLANPTKPK